MRECKTFVQKPCIICGTPFEVVSRSSGSAMYCPEHKAQREQEMQRFWREKYRDERVIDYPAVVDKVRKFQPVSYRDFVKFCGIHGRTAETLLVAFETQGYLFAEDDAERLMVME
jgi:hypothetical protein